MKKRAHTPRQAIVPPKVTKRKLIEGIPAGCLIAKEQYRTVSLSTVDLSSQGAAHVSFVEALLSQVNMTKTQLEELHLQDVCLKACTLVMANWYKAAAYRTEFIGCRMTGFLAGEALFQDVVFQDVVFQECQMNLAQFRFATFRSVRFERCDLSEADLVGADLSHVVLTECSLQHADLSGSKLDGVDLSTCNLDGARVGIAELRGATVDVKQALSLVEALGIEVKLQKET